MFNRSEIMRKAWAHYRARRASYAPWQIARGIVTVTFAASLREAWHHAKADAAREARETRIDAALAASARARVIVRQLETLPYRPLATDTASLAASLTAELDRLTA